MARETKKVELKPEHREQFGYVDHEGDMLLWYTIQEAIESDEASGDSEPEIIRFVATEVIKVKKQSYVEVSRSKVK